MPFHMVPPPPAAWRVGRLPEPFVWRLPLGDLVDGPDPVLDFGRWDAPQGEFPTLYCADSPVVAFAETIAAFRPFTDYPDGEFDDLAAEVVALTYADPPDPEFDYVLHSGELPKTYFEPAMRSSAPAPGDGRALAKGEITLGTFIDVTHNDTHDELNRTIGGLPPRYGFDRF